MNQPLNPEENPSSKDQRSISQQTENSTMDGMQAAIGDGNIQIQGNSNIVTFNKTEILQISVAEIKTRQFIHKSPYKGLKKFESGDKDLFFGRDQFLTGLVNELEQTNLILLLGASGSGKSSVVRAGLIPWLSQKWGSRLVNLTLTPDTDPFESFYASLLSKYKQSSAKIAREAKPDTLTKVVKSLKQPDDYWLILIDQFEELFTTSFADKRDNFITSLVQLSKTKEHSVKIVATMRADFLDRLSPYPQLVKATDKHRPLIAEMQLDELRLAIEQPAAQYGVVFEAGLVEEIIKDIQGQAGYLPLLQYTLNLLWETEVQTGSINDRTLNISTYRELGGVRGALQKHVDQIYSALLEPEKLATQKIFLKLVGIGGDSESGTEWKPVRRRANCFEFSDQLEQSVLVKLINENLLVSDRQPQAQESTVEIAHEILLTSWTTFNIWIKENRQAITLRNRLNDDVARWLKKKVEGELWGGSKLEQVLELRKDQTFNQILGGFSETASKFIETSVGLRDRQRRRIIVGLASFSTVTLLLSAFASWQLRTAKQQQVEQTAATAELLLLTEPVKGMVTALKAVALSQSPLVSFPNQTPPSSVQNSLFSAVQISQEKNLLKGHQGYVTSVAISTDDKTIVSGGEDGTVRLWNSNGLPIGTPFKSDQGEVTSVAISTDGKIIVSGGKDGTVRLWNSNGLPIGTPFQGHQEYVASVAISTDSKTILSRGEDDTVKLWNSNGQLIGKPFQGVQGKVSSIAISTDGKIIVSGGKDGTVQLWNSDGQPIGTPFKTDQEDVVSVAITADGKTIVSGGQDGTVKLWNSNGQPIGIPFKGRYAMVDSVAISTNGNTIVIGGTDGTVQLWNGLDEPIGLKGHQNAVNSVAISTDGKTIVSGGTDGTVRLWNSKKVSPTARLLKVNQREVNALAISTDGKTIVSGGQDGTVRLWNSSSQPISPPFQTIQKGVYCLAVSTNGKMIVSGSEDHTMEVWSGSGQPISPPFKVDQSVLSLAISADGKTIVSGGADGTVQLRNSTGQPISPPFHVLQLPVYAVAISTDGKTIVSGGADGTVQLWNSTGQPVSPPFHVHGQVVSSIAISTDGKTIVSGDFEGTVRLWDINFEHWVKIACERLRHHPALVGEARAACQSYFR